MSQPEKEQASLFFGVDFKDDATLAREALTKASEVTEKLYTPKLRLEYIDRYGEEEGRARFDGDKSLYFQEQLSVASKSFEPPLPDVGDVISSRGGPISTAPLPAPEASIEDLIFQALSEEDRAKVTQARQRELLPGRRKPQEVFLEEMFRELIGDLQPRVSSRVHLERQ